MNKIATTFFFLGAFTGSLWATPLNVSTAIVPVANLVKAVSGYRVSPSVIVPPGASPHIYEPSPRGVRALRQADLIVTIGNLELSVVRPVRLKQLAPHSQLLDLMDHSVVLGDHDHHHHGHTHSETISGDPHIWMSPRQMAIQSYRIAKSLSQFEPAREPMYRRNASAIAARLNQQTELYRKKFKSRGILVVVVHPSLSYLAADLGFTQLAIEQNGRAPTVKQLRSLIQQVRSHPHRVIVLQPQYGRDLVELVARETGSPVIEVDIYNVSYPNGIFDIAESIFVASTRSK